MILMSAIGPLPLAAIESSAGSYAPGIALMAVLPVLSIVGISFARVPPVVVNETPALATAPRATPRR